MKTRTAWLWIIIAIVVVALCAVFVVSRMSISALDSPGRQETRLATFAKHRIIARQAARIHIVEPAASEASANTGQVLFSVECATCHGKDGRSPTHIG